MGNFYQDNEDLRFYLERGLDWPKLVDLVERHYKDPEGPKDATEARDLYAEVMSLLGEFSANEIAPRAALIDAQGVHMKDGKVVMGQASNEVFAGLRELGVLGLCVPRELGGMNMPSLAYMLACEVLARADVSTMTHFGFHTATAMTLFLYSVREGTTTFDTDGKILRTRWQSEISEIIAGNAWGSMDLTEPDAGSDLAALRTRARQDAQGTWRVTGNKIFITSGHGNYHLVLAKTADEASLDALSLFLVPLELQRAGKTIKNGWVDRVEEKIGHHGSPTCSVQFEDSEAQLIGKVGEGFRLMLFLMNHARLGVGFEAIGLCEAALRIAKSYAAERRTMGQSIDQHPLIADMLDEMEVTTRGIRALAVHTAFIDEIAIRSEQLAAASGEEPSPELKKSLAKIHRQVRHATPLIKYVASEAAVKFARYAMQILGGNGYMKDYPAERLLRDALVLPVYEGTSQIQALMCLKDNLGAAMKNPQRFLRKLAQSKIDAVSETDPLKKRFYRMRSLGYSAQQHLILEVAKNKWTQAWSQPFGEMMGAFKNFDPKRDFDYGLLRAESLIRILANVAIAEVLVDEAARFPERRALAEAFVDRAYLECKHEHDMVVHGGDRVLRKLEAGRLAAAGAPVEGAAAQVLPTDETTARPVAQA